MICASDAIMAHLALVNQFRTMNGLYPLRISDSLYRAAAVKAAVIAAGTEAQFSHTEPSGRQPAELAEDYGYPVNGWIGENILWGTGDPTAAFEVWKNSPAHRDNMLHPSYTEIGIALNVEPVWDFGGDVFAVGVQLFGSANTNIVPACGVTSPIERYPTMPVKPPPRVDKGPKARLPKERPTKAQRARNRLLRKLLRRIGR